MLFPTNLMLHYHVTILDFLDLSSLFTIPSHLPCQPFATKPTDLQRTCKKPKENHEQVHMGRCHCNEVPAHMQNYGANPVPEQRGNSQPKCQRLPLVQGQCTMSRAGRTAREEKVNGGKGFLSPRCPQEPLHQRHELAATSPCKGAFAGPFHSHLFSVCFAFSPLGFSLFLVVLSGPGRFASSAVQRCWSCHAPAWELLIPTSLLQSPPNRTAQ